MRDERRANGETWIISRTEEGFRVYSPTNPIPSYIVGGSREAPTCTCPDFQYHEGDLRWRCRHIQAVLEQFKPKAKASSDVDPYDVEERRAIQGEDRTPEPQPGGNGNDAQMIIKRSVSPDGRIDSLSVEFSLPVDGLPIADIKAKAQRTLLIQSEIVAGFLSLRKPVAENHPAPDQNGPVPALLVQVGGMNGKWGRRLFINVQVNGKTAKLFGNRSQLAEHLQAAGYSRQADRIEEGLSLQLPCRVITRPSADGRFLDIEKVLPAEQARGGYHA
jgi:hypothetical protein